MQFASLQEGQLLATVTVPDWVRPTRLIGSPLQL